METTQSKNQADPANPTRRTKGPADEPGVLSLMAAMDEAVIAARAARSRAIDSERPDELEPYYQRERHLIEVTRQSRRHCWDKFGEGPAEEVTVWGYGWKLWLDRAETVEVDDDGAPVAAFHIDRMDGE